MKSYTSSPLVAMTVILLLILGYSLSGLFEESRIIPSGSPREVSKNYTKFILQRNNLSRLFNELAHKKAVLVCELQKEKKRSKPVSDTGGWCEETEVGNKYHHVTDKKLTDALADFYAGKTVASFGDGRGYYKKAIDKTGKLKCYDAYDGGPYYDKVSKGRVKYLDLTVPQYGLPLYDWVMSLEVAEHIPQQYEQTYVSNVVRHAREGIVLSWAVPGQGGLSHVNNKPLGYVIKTLRALGFEHDPQASKQLQISASLSWLKKNINVYRRLPNYEADENEI